MAHLDSVRPNAQWPNETVLTATDLQRFDANQAKTIDGVNGGSYAPTGAIIIGGGGLKSIVSGTQLSGGIATALGGRFQLGANDLPHLPSTRALTRICPLWNLPMQAPAGGTLWGGAGSQSLPDINLALSAPPLPMGVSIAPGVTQLQKLYVPIPSRFLIHRNNSVLASYTVEYRVLTRPLQVPASPFAAYLAGYTTADAVAFPGAPTNPSFTGGSFNWSTWATTTSYALGSYVVPTSAHANGLYFKATSVSGTHTSGGAEPSWPTTVGATVTDNSGANQIVWTCMGGGGFVNPNQTVDAYFAAGAAQTVTMNLDPAVTATLDNTANSYALLFTNLDPTILLHTVTFNFTGMSTMGFV